MPLAEPVLAAVRGPRAPIEIPADARFQALVRKVAAVNGASIYDWGLFELAGEPHRTATLVAGDRAALVGYLIETQPGSAVLVGVQTNGDLSEPSYPRTEGEPRWVAGVDAARALALAQSGGGSEHDADGITYRVLDPLAGESFTIALRGDVPVITAFDWYAKGDRDARGIRHQDDGAKHFSLAAHCAACEPVADFHAQMVSVGVSGPSDDPDQLIMAATQSPLP
jgi:hypothetical protein